MSLLTLVGDAMVLCGLSRPTIVYGNPDPTVQEFIAWAQVDGDDLALLDWPQLKALVTLTGDGSSTTYDLPTDFARWAGGNTFYLNGEAGGPLFSVSDEDMLKAKAQNTSPTRPIWRRFGDQIEFYPALTVTQVAKAEFRSEYWIMDSTLTTRQAEWAADDDETLFPDPLQKLGIAWRWKASKGLDYERLEAEYQKQKRIRFIQQDGRKDIRLPTIYPSDMASNSYDVTVVP